MEWLNGKNKQNDALTKLNVMAHKFSIFKKICAITMAKLGYILLKGISYMTV